jgi:hypothetical protein
MKRNLKIHVYELTSGEGRNSFEVGQTKKNANTKIVVRHERHI